MSLTFLDFFAGIGGFRRGMELAGHTCVGFCEYDKFAVMSYTIMHLATKEQREYIKNVEAPPKKNGDRNLNQRQKEILKEEYRNGEWYANDIKGVDARSLPDADCWCFGAPCQDFSVAGERKGLEGNRSSLVREVFRLVAERKEDRPKYLIYENVKGMLSSNNGWDFACILLEMESLGYDIEYQLFNSKDFGVPQNRERMYVIGRLRGQCAGKIFPITKSGGENRINIIGHRDGYRRNLQTYGEDGITKSLDTCQGGGREPHIAIPVLTPNRVNKRQNGRRFKENMDSMFTLTAQDRHGVAVKVKEATKQGYAIAEEGDSINLAVPRSQTRRGRVGKGVANTLDTSCNQGIFVQVSEDLAVYAVWHEEYQCYIAIRRLTPKECFRLQAWDDEYFCRAELVSSDSQLYKQAGNGVTVSVVHAIASQLNCC